MKTWNLRTKAFLVLFVSTLCHLASASLFYQCKVIANGGAGGSFIFFDGYLSINDLGNVAFTGGDQQGPGVFFARRNAAANPNTWAVEVLAHGNLQSVSLNNKDQVATVFQSTTAPRVASVRRYTYSSTWTSSTVAHGGDVRDQYGRFIYPFLNILPGVSMNDDGFVTFIGQDIYSTGLARLVQKLNNGDPTPTGLAVPIGTVLESTTLADRRMLVRTGSILLWNPDYTLSEGIAASGSGFTTLGERPGCSDDGKVVAFYGDLPDPAQADFFTLGNHDVVPLPVTSGPGIFASVKVGGRRHVVRVAGEVFTPNLDPGELLVGGIGEGQDYNYDGKFTNPQYDWQIISFIPDARVAVSNPHLFADTTKGSYVTVVYMGMNSFNGATSCKAIFSSRVNLFTNPSANGGDTVGVEAPVLVAQVGETLDGFGPTTDLGISDSANQGGQVAFWAKAGSAEAILVATPVVSPLITYLQRIEPDSPLVEYTVFGKPSPYGRAGATITQLILHATAGSEGGSLNELIQTPDKSVHYMISREGRVIQMIQEADKAVHAGVTSGLDVNQRSVGIELVDDCRCINGCSACAPGTGHTRNPSWFTSVQSRKAALLVRDIARRRQIQQTVPGINPGIFFPHLTTQSADGGSFETLVPATPGTPPGAERDGIPAGVVGIIGHGQVLNRLDGKTDPQNFPWPAFMTMVNQGIGLTLNSPANLLVTDPQGRRAGYDPSSGQTLLEIPGCLFTGPGTEPQSLSIPDATNGNYTIQVIGTSNGVFHLDILASGMDAGLTQTQVADTTAPGVVTTYTLNHDSVSGAATTVFGANNLPPVAYDDFATTVSNTPVAIAVLANDNDPEGFLNTNSVVVVTNPTIGMVTVNATNGIATYTPPVGFIGTNTFAYTVQDNQGAVSAPAIVTIIVTEPVVTTNTPPIAVNDSATTTNGIPVTINVLANDISTNGVLDPTTVTITRAPTNGTATVDAYTGAITYTPNAGFVGTNTFQYTVQDDLGSVSSPATVTVVVFGPPPPRNLALAPYVVGDPITSGTTDHRYPRINNLGDIVYQEQIGGVWQVVRRMAGESAVPATSVQGSYHQAQSPAIADDGRFICYRNATNSSLPRDILIYPNPAVALTNPSPTLVYSSHEVHNEYRDEVWECHTDPSITSDGRQVWGYDHWFSTISGNGGQDSSLNVGNQGVLSTSDLTQWSHPDANADGQFVYVRNNQVFFGGQALATGQSASINDAPRDNPDIVYANGTSLYSTLFGLLHTGTPGEISGTWVDINKNGVLVFERQVGGNYQVFKAFPWEVRIVSTGGTNGIVGLPYRYDGDNIAEAYGAPEDSADDPRGFLPLEWSLVSGPSGFTIEAGTGLIHWVPSAPGTYTAVIRVDTLNPDYGIYTEDTQTLTISVVQSTVELADAVDFRTPGTPDLPMTPTNYVSGGTPRIGAVADGASRLLLRVGLLGADTNSFPALHFAIAGPNAAYDGLLRGIMSPNWAGDVPAAIASRNGTNTAMCLYQAATGFDAASSSVRVDLLNGTNLIASQLLLLRRPPVVLVHDGWSGPEVWPVLISDLLDAGMDVYPVDYSFSAASPFNANESKIFLKNLEALGAVRQSGFAASRVDVVAHGTGGILARLHVQRYSAQDYNYRIGDVHKLITIGTPHAGSWLDGVLAQVRTNNPSVWTNLRSAVLAASEAGGRYPAVDLDGGLVTNAAPGSAALAELEALPVPAHAIVTGADALPPGDLYGFIEFCLGLANGAGGVAAGDWGDGAVSFDSARGGLATNAFTLLPAGWGAGPPTNGIPHSVQPFDAGLASLVLDLLTQPVATSSRFSAFPASIALTNLPPVLTPGTNFGFWLVLSGATNGQTFTAGQTVSLTATATGGHVLRAVQFLTPTGAVATTSAPFVLTFQLPATAVGRVRLTAGAVDATGQTAWATVALNVLPGATLQSLQVQPWPVVLVTKDDFPLRVLGTYDDGSQRDITSGSAGTKYVSSNFQKIAVSTNGVVHIFDPNVSTPLTVSITNGANWTNVQVSIALSNVPPTAYIAASRTTGPAPLDVQFDGSFSRGSGTLSFAWTFDDGTTSTLPAPAHRFVVPGAHLVQLAVTNSSGLVGSAELYSTVEPWLLMIDASLTLTQRLAFNAIIVTNGGSLVATNALDCGSATIGPGALSLLSRSTVTSLSLNGGEVTALAGLDGGTWRITNATVTLGSPSTNASILIASNGVVTTPALVALDLTVNGALMVASNGLIDATGKGYLGELYDGSRPAGGPGGGQNLGQPGSGGSHAGVGGYNKKQLLSVYGSITEPTTFGSGGGRSVYGSGCDGGVGGGGIRIQAQRTRVDGLVAADGNITCGLSGGGAGGSIYITTGVLEGNGTIRANGGAGLDYGGGGGRLAVYYGDKNGFAGSLQAHGGTGIGGPGTVYLKQDGETSGDLVVENAGMQSFLWPDNAPWTTLLNETSNLVLGRLVLGGSAQVVASNAVIVTVETVCLGTNQLSLASGSTVGTVVLTGGQSLTLAGVVTGVSLTVSGGGVLSQSGAMSMGSVLVGAGGTLTVPEMAVMDLEVSNFVVAVGGVISAVGKGYGPEQGPGAGVGYGSAGIGGSYGGLGGGSAATNGYGSFVIPRDFGSGGGLINFGGAGGGVIWLQAQRLQADGDISADGMWGASSAYYVGGGGSGGSIRIAAGVLTGSGGIHATGGWAYMHGGGGGRVAVYYDDRSGFSGTFAAFGLNGAGAGTVYWKRNSEAYGELVVDSGGYGSSGWSTPILVSGILRLSSFTVAGGARVSTPAGVRVVTGNPASFGGLISSNYLQVGSLWVDGQWVYGDMMELEAGMAGGSPRIGFFTRPNQPYIIEASTNLSLWTPILTNASTNGIFEWIETNTVQRRFFRSRQ